MPISTIRLISDREEINQLYDFIRRFPLYYPNYEGWVKQCYEELVSGNKRAFVFRLENQIIGSLVFQRHKKEPEMLEIKNLRVDEQYKRRKIASRFLKELEEFAKNHEYSRLIVDTHSDNLPVIKTFQNAGFIIISEESLYNSRKEVVLSKDIK